MSEAGSRRIGIFGGTFDPVHLGHLMAAQDACELVGLDRVIFMPAWQAPLREGSTLLGAAERLELLRLAVSGDARFEVSTIELDRKGVSYSVDTARALARERPGAQLFWIIGADQAQRLHEWRDITAMGRIVEFIVLARPGFAGVPASLPSGVRVHSVDAHQVDIGATEIRRRMIDGDSVRYFLPAPVADWIEKRQPWAPARGTRNHAPVSATRDPGRALDGIER